MMRFWRKIPCGQKRVEQGSAKTRSSAKFSNFLTIAFFALCPTRNTIENENKSERIPDEFGLVRICCFGGSGWIRTTEVGDNRFTVCPLWPLGYTPSSSQPTLIAFAGKNRRMLTASVRLLYEKRQERSFSVLCLGGFVFSAPHGLPWYASLAEFATSGAGGRI